MGSDPGVDREPNPADVMAMTVAEFEQRFGFRPADKLEKYMFAVTGERLKPIVREMIEAGIGGPEPDLSKVNW